MTVYKIKDKVPVIHETAFIANEATIIGNVQLKEKVSVWPGAVIRADNDAIEVGAQSNVQEGAVLHVDSGKPLKIGQNVTIGHQAMLHGCSIGDGSLIGIQAVILNGAVIGKNCLVAAGAVITENKTFPDRSLIVGAPAKVLRELDDTSIQNLLENAAIYVQHGENYKNHLIAISFNES